MAANTEKNQKKSNAGRKSKYDPDTFPLLAEGLFRDGLNDEQVAAKLGISHDAFYSYQKKFPEFSEAIKRGKRPVDVMVENALLKSAIGFDYEEIHTEYIEDQADGKNGDKQNSKAAKSKRITKITKQVVGNVTAQRWWLKNRCRSKWSDKPGTEAPGSMIINFGDDERDL